MYNYFEYCLARGKQILPILLSFAMKEKLLVSRLLRSTFERDCARASVVVRGCRVDSFSLSSRFSFRESGVRGLGNYY